MSIRSMMLATAMGAAGLFASVGTSAADTSHGATAQNGGGGGGFQCVNKLDIQVVSCVGTVAVIPVNVNIKDIGVLDDNDLNVLSNDLNGLSLKDINVLDNIQILDDVKALVLADVLDKFLIDITDDAVNVCTTVLGAQLCK